LLLDPCYNYHASSEGFDELQPRPPLTENSILEVIQRRKIDFTSRHTMQGRGVLTPNNRSNRINRTTHLTPLASSEIPSDAAIVHALKRYVYPGTGKSQADITLNI
jgi:hypothetical protein